MAESVEELLERESETAALERMIEEARGGSGRVVVLEGAAGIGKSRLLAAARLRAEGRLRVLAARGGELEREFSFGVVRQLFESAVTDPGERARALAGAAAPAAPVFAAVDDAPAEGSFATLHGLFWLVLNLAADRPLMLAVDDLHWCDRPSLRFLSYLSRRLEDLPVLLATSLRSAEPGTDPALLAELVRDPSTVTLQLSRLSRSASAALVRSGLPAADEPFCDECHDATDGIPLLLRQLVRAVEADGVEPVAANTRLVRDIGPRAVSRTVLARLARLSPAAIAVARSVAVLGEGAALPQVAALAGIEEAAGIAAARELARAEILRPDAPLGFVHALVRHAVYDEMTGIEHGREHARAAALLHESGAPPELVAGQLLLAPAGGGAWASQALEAAGAGAVARGAPEGAVAYLRRALEELLPEADRVRILLALSAVEHEVDAPRSVAHLEEALPLISDPAIRAAASRRLVSNLAFVNPSAGHAIARRSMAELPAELEDERRALLALEAFSRFLATGEPGEMPWLAEVVEGPDLPGFGARSLDGIAAIGFAVAGGSREVIGRVAQRALRDGLLLERDSGLFWPPAIISLVLADWIDAAREHFGRARELAHRRGSLFSVLAVDLWEGVMLARTGDLEGAEERLTSAVEENQLWLGNAGHASPGQLAQVLIARGDLDGAERQLALASPTRGNSDPENFVRQARLLLALGRGRPADALAAGEELIVTGSRVRNPAWLPVRSLLALPLHALGREAEARALAAEELELARAWGAPSTVGRGLALLGRLEGQAGIPRLEEAVTVLAASPARLEEARALVALGGALRRARRPTEAREPLRRGLELAESCGAAPLVAEARSELHAAGARPRSAALSGPASLTPSERRVADLAAAGRTNRDIAQELYVTPKTVEVHLSHAYRKLGVSSRRELPPALAA